MLEIVHLTATNISREVEKPEVTRVAVLVDVTGRNCRPTLRIPGTKPPGTAHPMASARPVP